MESHQPTPLRRIDPRPKRYGGHGSPLVLLHPFGLCANVWTPLMPTLKRSHEVFALAIPGHRGADPLPDAYRYDIESCVDILERKLDELGLVAPHVAGCSLGGWLAIELARRGRARSVVAIAPGGGWQPDSWEQRRLHLHFRLARTLLRVGGPLALRLSRFRRARSYMLRDAVAQPGRLTPSEARHLIESLWRCEVYDDVVRALRSHPPAEHFEALPCPVRLVWGAEDRLLPLRGYSERWLHALPGAEWVVIPGVGHLPMYDDPAAVARAMLALTAREEPARLTG